jgi:hypothetical protein
MIPLAEKTYNNHTILTPRDLHPDKINNKKTTICILDVNFLDRHPRSQKRVAFVQSYCDLYGIALVQ